MMLKALPHSFFITGTDTGVGKTVVSAILTLGLSAHYWKPIQSGGLRRRDEAALNSDLDLCDSEFLRSVGVPHERVLPERFFLSRPLSPHLSARLDGKQIALADFELPVASGMKNLIVEGAGGLLVPINDQDKIIDLIHHLELPVILVARSALGTINHTLLSLEAMKARSIETLGVVMTGEKNEENKKAIEHFGEVEVLAEVPVLNSLTRETLLAAFAQCFNGGVLPHGHEDESDLASVHADAYSRPSAQS